MKKYLSLFAVLALAFFVNASSLNAQYGTGDLGADLKLKAEVKSERAEVRADMNVKTQASREEAKQKMEALKVKIQGEKDAGIAKAKEMRITGREKALERFDKIIEKITELKERISLKISAFEEKGVDVTAAKAFVVTAETNLLAAKNKVVEINLLLAASADTLTLENKTELRTLAQETQTLIVEAHKSLRDAVKSLKEEVKAMLEDLKNIAEDDNDNDEEEDEEDEDEDDEEDEEDEDEDDN